MKIGIYDPYLDDIGGGEKYMLTMAECLSQAHDVSIFWDNSDDLKIAKKRFSLTLDGVKMVPNIFTKKTSTFARINETKKYGAVIVLSDGSIPLVSSKLYIHFQRPLEHVKLNIFEKLKVKRVKTFFCNSEFTKEYIDRKYKIRSKIIFPPVAISPKKVEKKNIILHVGRFRPFDRTNGSHDYKKQGVMIKVFKELYDAKLIKSWKFKLAVSVNKKDEEAFGEMRKDANGYPIEFLVNKNNDELWDLYSEAKIYWHATGFGEDLEKHPEFSEHFGISTVEAMGAGCVPIVINAGGQKEIITDLVNGFLWNDLEELKEKTILVAESEKLYKELSSNAKTRAKDFSLKRFNEQVLSLVEGNL